ncbi:peptidase U32 [Candidatus Saganbacteria bacterium CG08_land_8_20_14_0_20_45_16]|uniref:Peptidase U32 n=1 Tax=Candidatus Saganbacteria bacterium CG08_land_8_20_14_0_20_45_16 TaxID=2014293 RepID=A0A2H0XVU3_UNCSA|nr:MAG: peptidase U32 [Candidatus Saganbacteria bacterium CG08_land_8_20_14_0_20_45_16]
MPSKPELLSPAGDLEKLEAAVRFGADAVYVGAGPYSLRAQPTSFNLKELKIGIVFAHKHKVKVYLAINIFAFNEDLPKMLAYLKAAVKAGIDAAIISDPGFIRLVRKELPKLKLHLSTQANTLNSEAVKFWHKQGVSRIVLGREVSLAQVKQIKKRNPKVELELFVHGAMCISYAGRCLLSKHMTGRSANRGECTQPCRWEYRLKEVARPNEEFLIGQDQRSTYILNSKDLCLIDHISKLIKAGVDSFKIEGRMKSVYYAALTTKIYREAIKASPKRDPKWKIELAKTSHRQFTTGFYLAEEETESLVQGGNVRTYTFVGTVLNQDFEVAVRNQIKLGDELDAIDPCKKEIISFKVMSIKDKDGQSLDQAHNGAKVWIESDLKQLPSSSSLLRRKISL